VSVTPGPPVGGRVLIVAKAPAPGRAKTRLVPPLTPDQAAALQTALLLDTLDSCRAQAGDVRLLVPSAADEACLAALSPGTPIERQQGRGLADALRLGLDHGTRDGPTALVSSDIPGVPPGSLEAAFRALGSADIVLGPATDGGYWLIAAAAPHAAPFAHIPWSTPATLAVTLRRCQDAGLRVHLLHAWRDVDTAADLAALRDEAALAQAPRTRAALAAIDPGVTGGPAPPLPLASELVLGTPWRSVLADRLRRRNGTETSYAYLAVPRAVFVVPVTPDGQVILVRQYRHPVRDWTLEVPAGSAEDGESTLEAARRELLEEVGGHSDQVEHLASFYSSSAHMSLRSDAFLARDVVLGTSLPEPDENLEQVTLPLAEVIRRARTGAMVEGQTALALLLAAARLEDG
jgi:rSAM/selenodomain-associated transferase 1